jgi:DNA-binding winged helix-turn-helix (wHTH) protein/tetratricopeptide (TPR) repeat protein
MAGGERYEFGEFTLDVAERQLSRSGQPVPLPPKTHDVLVALARHAGQLVTKHELLGFVWPESFVEEGILSVHISTLRKALGDATEPRRFIETVSRSGYRFLGVVKPYRGSPSIRPEVYELVGQGRSHLLKASMFEVPKAIAAFRAAIEMDPSYAAAHAGLALACCAAAAFRITPYAEAYGEARTAALRALGMDDSCADAQVALGAVLFLSDWNWAGAEKSLKRALQISPDHTEACLLYGRLLEALGKLEDGLRMKLKALEREPFSAEVHLAISHSYWNQRRYNDSIAWANRALDLHPQHPHAREFLAGAYWKKGDFDRYIAENVKHAEVHGVPAKAFEPLQQAYAAGGSAGARSYMLGRLSSLSQAPAMQLAIFYGEAGDLNSAFRYLDRAIESRDPSLVHLAVAPQWDGLRADPRFHERLTQMGLRPACVKV